MSWLSFTARKWFSAALTIARRCDGRAWNVSHTKFLSPISTLQPRLNPVTCHFSCVLIEIDLCSVRNTGLKEKGNDIRHPSRTPVHAALARSWLGQRERSTSEPAPRAHA